MAANSPAHYEIMARELEAKRRHLGTESEMVSKSDQHRGLASDIYHGGAIVPGLASLHPGLYHLGLLERVTGAGARVFGETPVTGIRRDGDGFEVATSRGTLYARNVAIATNGYTGPATPWLRRRVVPFRGFMIATEELDEARLSRIVPKGRTMHDFNNNLVYMRRAPDTRRLLLGARTGTMTDDVRKMAPRLHDRLTTILPEMKDVRIARAWNGFGAGTFDLYPHIGTHDGLHYATGYCFCRCAHGHLSRSQDGTVHPGRPGRRNGLQRPPVRDPLVVPWHALVPARLCCAHELDGPQGRLSGRLSEPAIHI